MKELHFIFILIETYPYCNDDVGKENKRFVLDYYFDLNILICNWHLSTHNFENYLKISCKNFCPLYKLCNLSKVTSIVKYVTPNSALTIITIIVWY